MILSNKQIVHNGALTQNTGTKSTGVQAPGATPPFMAFLNLSAIGGGTSLVVKLQHSPDGVNWIDLVTFAAKTAVGVEAVAITGPVFPNLRVFPTFTGGTLTGTAEVSLFTGVK